MKYFLQFRYLQGVLLGIVFTCIFFLSDEILSAQTVTNWPMAGANPQRTSWTTDPGPGMVTPTNQKYFLWATPIEPYAPITNQPIVAEGKVFVSTSKGLYAFNADTGAVVWTYHTELPLGNSATYYNGHVYVGGLDRKIHKIAVTNSAQATGTTLPFTADAGFETNPLIISDSFTGNQALLITGSRDGKMYGFNLTTNNLAWTFDTANGLAKSGQILQSAAYKDGKVFFSAMNGYVYGITISNNSVSLAWKKLLPSMGWRAYWATIFQDKVVFTRTDFERNTSSDFSNDTTLVKECNYIIEDGNPASGCGGNDSKDIVGQLSTVSNNWAGTPNNVPNGMQTVDVSINPINPTRTVVNYLQTNPDARSIYVLNQSNGTEIATPPPYLGATSDTNTAYPPIISGYDGIFYTRNPIIASGSFSGSMAHGWKYGTSTLSLPIGISAGASPDWPMDEPTGMSGGGKYIYYHLIIGRHVGVADLSQPNTDYKSIAANAGRQKRYFSVDAFGSIGATSEVMKFFWEPTQIEPNGQFHYNHNYATGPAIYGDKAFYIIGNALIAVGPTASANPLKTTAASPSGTPVSGTTLTPLQLQVRLAQEIEKLVAKDSNGNYIHYKPAYVTIGTFDRDVDTFGPDLTDYWSNPAETITILTQAIPHIAEPLRSELKSYIQTEFNTYFLGANPNAHIGWVDGAFRQSYDWPPNGIENHTMQKTTSTTFYGKVPPQNVYAMYKYAEAGLCTAGSGCSLGTLVTKAQGILSATVPTGWTDTKLQVYPHAHNAYIAGYEGYVKLATLAGQSATAYQTELNRLKSLRQSNFVMIPSQIDLTAVIPNPAPRRYYSTLNTAWNFMYLTPELGDYLHDGANYNSTIKLVLDTYTDKAAYPGPDANNGQRAPYWMVAETKEVQGENGIVPYYQHWALFQAKALVAQETQAELTKYLDSPTVQVGDLFYIDNIVATLNAGSNPPPPTPTATPTPSAMSGDLDGNGQVNLADAMLLFEAWFTTLQSADITNDGKVNSVDFQIVYDQFD